MNSPVVPVLPESAPFTVEQRAYLNGFLAGLFSYTRVPTGEPFPSAPPAAQALTILFGSQTGTAEKLAKRIAKEAGKSGFAPTIHDLAQYPPATLSSERCLLLITSTYGDGDPPDNAKGFWESLQKPSAPKLEQLNYSVCGLGDSNYAKFCGFAKDLDLRINSLGGRRVFDRVDCDVDYEVSFSNWLARALSALRVQSSSTESRAQSFVTGPESTSASSGETIDRKTHSRENPFKAPLIGNRRLNGPGSEKDVRHIEFDLRGSTLRYEAGDALGVMPQNDSAMVNELLERLRASGNEPVNLDGTTLMPLRDALVQKLEITRIPKALLSWMSARTGDAMLCRLAAPDANGELTQFLRGREIIDLLAAHPEVSVPAQEFVKLLRKLQPRLYSISSSPLENPGQVHLTVGAVRYESLGRARRGVCSTYLADRVAPAESVGIFVHANSAFRPPAAESPLIMVGPGTGIAPFRAFLQERRAQGARGKNWLFFGDQRSNTDFLYQDEIQGFVRDGLLTRLDLAWSRDQAGKVYVQDRMRSAGAELWDWLETGAAFYVCGDASRMAKDVENALLEIVQTQGGKTDDQSREYLAALKSTRRYQRDVY